MQAQGRPKTWRPPRPALAAQNAKLDVMLNGGRPEAVAAGPGGARRGAAEAALLQKGATDDVRQAAASAVSADTAQVAATEAALCRARRNLGRRPAESAGPGRRADRAGRRRAVGGRFGRRRAGQPEGSSAADIQAAQTALRPGPGAR